MGRVLPILFNTEMVRAILDGRKTVTRRAVKYKYSNTEMRMHTDKYGTRLIEIQKDIEGETHGKNPDGGTWHKLLPYIEKNPPCKRGDILYVRETWSEHYTANSDGKLVYCYKADGINLKSECLPGETNRWYPSIHMPGKAARIWLKVTDVRVERLQDITNEQILEEGADKNAIGHYIKQMPENTEEYIRVAYLVEWQQVWDSAVKRKESALYGWEANPWVWVIEFERCEKTEGAG